MLLLVVLLTVSGGCATARQHQTTDDDGDDSQWGMAVLLCVLVQAAATFHFCHIFGAAGGENVFRWYEWWGCLLAIGTVRRLGFMLFNDAAGMVGYEDLGMVWVGAWFFFLARLFLLFIIITSMGQRWQSGKTSNRVYNFIIRMPAGAYSGFFL